MSEKASITSPVGRIVMGSLYKPTTTDAEGKPLVIKTGPNAGQPRVNYFFALAIPKGAENHWANTPWGQKIWAEGHGAFPGIASNPAFAWKIEDGDSQIPNKKGRKPCDNEGWKGHWIIKLSGGFAPKVYRQENGGYVQVIEADYVKPGYYVEVFFTVEGNNSAQQPGVYLNHSMVCFRAYGSEISFGPDVNAAGFGQAALPAGASATPLASATPMPQLTPSGAPAVPQPAIPAVGSIPAPVAMAPLPMASAAPAVPVVPNPSFVQVPPPAAPVPMVTLPAIPQIPIVPPAKQMTAAAKGIAYEAYIASGWTDALLVQHGMMVA